MKKVQSFAFAAKSIDEIGRLAPQVARPERPAGAFFPSPRKPQSVPACLIMWDRESATGSTCRVRAGSLRCEGIRGDGGREPTDRHDLVSERDPRFLLVRRPDPAQLVQYGGEQVEESFQPLHILDHPNNLERLLRRHASCSLIVPMG